MGTDTGNSILMTRGALDAVPEQLRKEFWSDTPPMTGDDVLQLPDGTRLIHVPRPAEVLRERLGGLIHFDGDSRVVVEPDRRLFRVAPMFTEAREADRRDLPWNLRAVGVGGGKRQPTGKGAVVAVLDSGLDFGHPDFPQAEAKPPIVLDGPDAIDRNGHGTHCAGIVAGPVRPAQLPRYGVAPDATLLVVNVYDGDGESSDWKLLRGLLAAHGEGAHVISLSIGDVPSAQCPEPSFIFELVARVLMEYGTVIVAAAGNESDRMEPYIGAIVHPADCPSIIAVASITEDLRPSRSSSGGICKQRMPALCAPGVGIRSSFLTAGAGADGPYFTLSGTSAAAPHVAGVAALWVEAGYTGERLYKQLLGSVRALSPKPERDFGAGLVQAPN
ncbi:MAG TPA: S8 family serine peptidase [Thermoanaerobaculia bacterium]|jgi:subtilisin family serine protease